MQQPYLDKYRTEINAAQAALEALAKLTTQQVTAKNALQKDILCLYDARVDLEFIEKCIVSTRQAGNNTAAESIAESHSKLKSIIEERAARSRRTRQRKDELEETIQQQISIISGHIENAQELLRQYQQSLDVTTVNPPELQNELLALQTRFAVYC